MEVAKEKTDSETQSQLGHISTDALVQELSHRQGVQAFITGLYAGHEASIRRKYSADRTPVTLPDSSVVLVVERL